MCLTWYRRICISNNFLGNADDTADLGLHCEGHWGREDFVGGAIVEAEKLVRGLFAIIQEKDGDDFNLTSRGGGEKWLNHGYNLNIDPMGFAEWLKVGNYERKD